VEDVDVDISRTARVIDKERCASFGDIAVVLLGVVMGKCFVGRVGNDVKSQEMKKRYKMTAKTVILLDEACKNESDRKGCASQTRKHEGSSPIYPFPKHPTLPSSPKSLVHGGYMINPHMTVGLNVAQKLGPGNSSGCVCTANQIA
jgi:UTP-glucose-1-phosphate uridylyltransferase